MDAVEFVESLMPSGWTDPDNRDAVIAEVEVLLEETDAVLVRETIGGIFDAMKSEFDV
jgi:hypothetical protein